MIRTYDTASNAHMLTILEVLMAKAISYTWASIRGFYSYLAWQVELRRLDWDRITEIRDLASTFFKHSDLRSTHSRNLNSSASSSLSSGSSSQDLTAKGCQAWNYKGSCSCDSTASNYASHHLCRVCKSSELPMLHCPKQKMPIPNQQWLDSQTIGLTVYTDYDTDSDTDTKTEPHMLSQHEFFSANSSCAFVAYILAMKSPQPNAYGAKILVSSQLNISVWRHYLTDYVDHVVVAFLQFGWPTNYTSSVLPQPTHTNHQSPLAYPEDVQHPQHQHQLNWASKLLLGPLKRILYRTTLLRPFYRQSTNVVLLRAGLWWILVSQGHWRIGLAHQCVRTVCTCHGRYDLGPQVGRF